MNEQTEGIKSSIDNIIGADTFLKNKKKTPDDLRRERFERVITLLEGVDIRTRILGTDLNIDLSQYDEKFHDIIDELLFLLFGKEACELISFYLYDRITEDGNLLSLESNDGEIVSLLTPSDLWYLIKDVNAKEKKLMKNELKTK